MTDILPKVDNIEVVCLGDTNANTLTLTLVDVLDLLSTSDILVIYGVSTDTVSIDLLKQFTLDKQTYRVENYNI